MDDDDLSGRLIGGDMMMMFIRYYAIPDITRGYSRKNRCMHATDNDDDDGTYMKYT
jgi:hypothetical protein